MNDLRRLWACGSGMREPVHPTSPARSAPDRVPYPSQSTRVDSWRNDRMHGAAYDSVCLKLPQLLREHLSRCLGDGSLELRKALRTSSQLIDNQGLPLSPESLHGRIEGTNLLKRCFLRHTTSHYYDYVLKRCVLSIITHYLHNRSYASTAYRHKRTSEPISHPTAFGPLH